MRRLLLAVALAALPADAGTILEASVDSVEVVTSSTAAIDYRCSYTDNTTTAFTPSKSQGQITTATTTTVVAAPAASTQRNVIECSFTNLGTVANILRVQGDTSAANRVMVPNVSLSPNESLHYSQQSGWYVLDSNGAKREISTLIGGYNGRSYTIAKLGTAKDAAGYWIAYAKDAGHPGAYSLGTPGVNGVNTDCSLGSSTSPAGASQMGANYITNPASGANYIVQAALSSSIAEFYQLVDVVWYNTGLVVTTTTAQAITTPTFPARDNNGSSNGDGYFAAIVATAALGNAAVISNTTLQYTNSDNVSGRTGTFAASVGWQAPATPVIGTWMPFQLQAGDRGIRSIQSITLATTYTSGSMSLVVFNPIASIPVPVANVGGALAHPIIGPPGIRLYNGTCMWPISVGSATLGNIAGGFVVAER